MVIIMKVGFLGFGEVASNISKWLIDGGAEVYTSIRNRSLKTQNLARKYPVNICKDNKTVAEISEILISTVTPSEAVNIAKEVGDFTKGIYVDINSVSPQTAKEALGYIKNRKTVDAAIMGGIKKEGIKVQIIASGLHADHFSELNQYGLNIRVISPQIGQAKALKMLRSSYTKGVSALLFESLYSAYKMGLDEELIKCLEKTECPEFRKISLSRITSSAIHAERRAQEVKEVLGVISEFNEHHYMSQATSDTFRNISKTIKLDKKSKDYRDVFKCLE